MSTIKVLHVDDDQPLVDVSKTFLEKYNDNFEVMTTTDPTTVIDYASGVDCIVSDYNMPQINGLELLELIKGEYPHLPFILFTGKGSEEIASDAITAGVDDYLQKGSSDQYHLLSTRIKNIVDKQRIKAERNRGLEAIESARDSIGIVDPDGYFIYVNNSFSELLGYSCDALHEMHWRDLYESENDILNVKNNILTKVREKGEWKGETQWVREDGEVIWIDQSLSMTTDGHLICTAKNIDVKVKRKQKFKQQEEIINQSINQLDDIYFFVNSDGELENWNIILKEVTGYTNNEIDSMNIVDFFTGFDKQSVETTLVRVLDGWGGQRLTAEINTKDGSSIRYEINLSRIADEQGNVIGLCGIGRETSDAEELRRKLEINEQALSALYSTSTNSKLTFDQKIDQILKLSQERLQTPLVAINRIKDEELIVEYINSDGDIEPGVSCPLSQSFCRLTVDQKESVVVEKSKDEWVIDDPAYQKFGFETYIGSSIYVRGELYGTLCFGDTERTQYEFTTFEKRFVELLAQWISYELEERQAKEELRQQNERLNEFTRIVSHDMRNPLGVASGRVALARDTGDLSHLNDVIEALDRMDDIISYLLKISRGSKWADEPTELDIQQVAEQAWDFVDVPETAELYTEPVTITADYNGLLHLFENLFRNSLDYVGRNVTVRVGHCDGGFYVEDNGNSGSIDDIFSDVSISITEGESIGLSIVNSIATSHGWEITPKESEDGGARFEFRT